MTRQPTDVASFGLRLLWANLLAKVTEEAEDLLRKPEMMPQDRLDAGKGRQEVGTGLPEVGMGRQRQLLRTLSRIQSTGLCC